MYIRNIRFEEGKQSKLSQYLVQWVDFGVSGVETSGFIAGELVI
jgi:hypothetical protein